MEIPPGGLLGIRAYGRSFCCLRVQQFLIISITLDCPHYSSCIHIRGKSIIHRSPSPHKIWQKKAKATTKVTITSHQLKYEFCFLSNVYLCLETPHKKNYIPKYSKFCFNLSHNISAFFLHRCQLKAQLLPNREAVHKSKTLLGQIIDMKSGITFA